jgi:threonine-phosphate decarboxylase
VNGEQPYWLPVHGGQLGAIAEQFGVERDRLIDFSANINPDGPPAALLAGLRAAVDDLSLLTNYPDLEERTLRDAVAKFASVSVGCCSVANGFAPLLAATVRALAVRRCLLPVPAFSEYRRMLEHAGVEVMPMWLPADREFHYDVDAILTAAARGGCDTVLLANPQNPSGVLCSAEEMRTLLSRSESAGLRVLLDEAFIDYAPEESITREAPAASNLMVFRSVTKFFSVPGLRVAFAVSNDAWGEKIRSTLAPWAITTLAARAVICGLSDTAFADTSREGNRRRRMVLTEALEALGLRVYPGRANFLLFQIPDGETLRRHMITRHHIVLRSCANYEGLDATYLRTAVRSEAENRLLLEALGYELEHLRD